MNDRPNMTPPLYEAQPTESSGHARARIDTPEQQILENLANWARTNAWAQRIAAAKARAYSLALEGERDRK